MQDTQLYSGLYIVSLNNEEPISINSQDPRCADKVYKANKKNIKVGRAKSFKARKRNYIKTFKGETNVNFCPVVFTKDINKAEKLIKIALNEFRVRNPISKRKTEWLLGITSIEAFEIIKNELAKSEIEYSIVDNLT